MDTAEYEREAMRTGAAASGAEGWSIAGMGIAGEAGEVCDLLKKHVHHERPLDVEALKKELGDVLWYVALACHLGGFTLDEVMRVGIAKLRARFPDGWSPAAAAAKADEARRG